MKSAYKNSVPGVLALMSFASVAASQTPVPREPNVHRSDMVGGSVTLINPVGEFGDFVDFGGGLGFFAVKGLDRDGQIGLRFDASFVVYGHERFTEPFNSRISRVQVDVSTDNFIASFGVGPQLTLGHGVIRPYFKGSIGFSYFATESSVSGTRFDNEFASTTNFDDFTFTVTGGAGLLFRVAGGRKPVSLDLSVGFVDNGETSYLRRGGIVDLPGGGVRINPIVSETDLLQYRIGIAVTI